MLPDPDIWRLIFEQTPPAVRWILGVLSLGLFTLATHFWKKQHEAVAAIEDRERNYMSRDEFNERLGGMEKRLDNGFVHIHARMDAGFASIHRRIDHRSL